MKLSEYIKQLTTVLEHSGDNEIDFRVKDYYSIGLGENATHNIDTNTSLWSGVYSNGGVTTLSLRLSKSPENKQPKIIYRK